MVSCGRTSSCWQDIKQWVGANNMSCHFNSSPTPTWTKWTPFRRYFQMLFVNEKFCILITIAMMMAWLSWDQGLHSGIFNVVYTMCFYFWLSVSLWPTELGTRSGKARTSLSGQWIPVWIYLANGSQYYSLWPMDPNMAFSGQWIPLWLSLASGSQYGFLWPMDPIMAFTGQRINVWLYLASWLIPLCFSLASGSHNDFLWPVDHIVALSGQWIP